MQEHQYIDRQTGAICTEQLYGDTAIAWLYGTVREHAPAIFRMLTSPRFSQLLAMVNFDRPAPFFCRRFQKYLQASGVDLSECLDDYRTFRSPRDFFERRLRYWDCRPLPARNDTVVAPADARVLTGSLQATNTLFIKNKFFDLAELLGADHPHQRQKFANGDYAIFRLTPDKYHYNHSPVSGRVLEIYNIDGACHSCNPSAMISVATPLSKNARVVTILDTDQPGGSNVGLVAMIEIVALMIGGITQCYSAMKYDNPLPVQTGTWLEYGAPKSLFHPGSSTVVLLFQAHRIAFAADITANLMRTDVQSRFAAGLGRPLTETNVQVRSLIALKIN